MLKDVVRLNPWAQLLNKRDSFPLEDERNTRVSTRNCDFSHIRADVNIGKLRISAMKEGMKTLRLSGAHKVSAGDTTIAEVLRVAPFSGVE